MANESTSYCLEKTLQTNVDGGLGLKNLSAWNKALLVKTLWNIHRKQDTLWIKWISQLYNNRDSVWVWQWHREQSPLIKQILHIREILVDKNGTVEAAIDCLEFWFNNSGGVSKAYDFFVGQIGNWPWNPILWKGSILPKHRYALWIFSHRKFLTKDRLGFLTDVHCVLCNDKLETFNHLFFECPATNGVWSNIWL